MLYDKSGQALLKNFLHHVTKYFPTNNETPNKYDIALETLKQYILKNDLHPGDPIPTEAKLCQEINISRTSVREALRRLEALDIVESQQGRGTFVGSMSLRPLIESLVLRSALNTSDSKASLQDVVEIRLALDLGNATALVKAMDTADITELDELVEQMLAQAQNGRLFTEQDIAFHTKLLALLNNPLLVQFTAAMWVVHMAIVPKIHEIKTAEICQTAQSHQDMLTALKQKDIAGYCQAVLDHYTPLLDRIENE